MVFTDNIIINTNNIIININNIIININNNVYKSKEILLQTGGILKRRTKIISTNPNLEFFKSLK